MIDTGPNMNQDPTHENNWI